MPVLKFFTEEELNFFKFASIVYDEIPKMLRQTFETMWDNKIAPLPGYQRWDDSPTVHNLFQAREGKTKKLTYKSLHEWDCTALFNATIYSKTFGVTTTTTTKTLSDQYVKGKKPSTFHSSLISPTANQDESLTLAIDQLRLLRNTLCHKSNPSLSKIDFDQYVQLAKDAFTATGVSTDRIDDIGNLGEEDFPTKKVIELNEKFQAHLQEINNFLQKDVVQELSDQQENIKHFQECVLQILHKMQVDIKDQGSGKAIQLNTVLLVILLVAVGVALFQPTKIYQSSPSTLAVPGWMNTSNPIFIGRRWLFKQLEDFFEKNGTLDGALLVGDPGSGKTAIMKQLVHSPINSSSFIHQNIIAYHFCQFDSETTRDGEKFVKSLVEQLSRNVPGFKKSIQGNEAIQNMLLNDCKTAPIECGKRAVFEALHALKNISTETKKFILVDALDECREKKGSDKSVIIDILHGQRVRLPIWVKLLMSSRNVTAITGKMSEIKVGTIAINETGKNNFDDIRSFAQEMISRHDFRKTNGESMKEKINESIERILNKTDGNFLFISTLLEEWATNPDKIDLTSIPSDMNLVYALSFRNRFEKEELNGIAKLFEVFLASNWPLTLKRLHEILTLKDPVCEWDKVVNKLYPYLRLDNEIVRIYHQSFAEWLTIHNEPIDGFSIKKSRGHQYLADYLFDHYNEPENELTVKGLYELSMHVLNGGMLKTHVRKLKGLNSEVTDQFNESILHYLARNRESTDVLKLFISPSRPVDILNKDGLSPAYYATTEGNYRNLELLIERGADVNYVARDFGFCGSHGIFRPYIVSEPANSLIFIAVYKGYTDIVELLIKKGAHFDKETKCGWKPLHAAIGKGCLGTVKLLINKADRTFGGLSDVAALHQATVSNQSNVLKFLLETGVRDKCMPCKQEYTTDVLLFTASPLRLFDKICGSVLNTAVSRSNLTIVEMLLLYGNDTLECKSYAGLTPLMRAIERNDLKMVKLLLEAGANVEAQCETKSLDADNQRSYLTIIYKSIYYCYCTSKAIHISAVKGTSKITTELINRNVDLFSRDCLGWSAIDLAVSNNQFANTSLQNNKTMMRYLAVCGSLKTLEQLSRSKSSDVLTGIHEDGMTLLHLATLGLTNLFYPVCSMINCTAFNCPHMKWSYTVGVPNAQRQRNEQYLNTIKLLTKVSPQSINKKDKHGRTALHYAALVRSPDVVKHLIQKGSDWKIKENSGYTALEFMLKRPLDYLNNDLGACSTVIYSLFNSSKVAISNEMHVSCLVMLKTLNIPRMVGQAIVEYMALHNLPLSWYTLLKIDADLNILSHEYSSDFHHDRWLKPYIIATISELLKVLKFDIEVNCEVPFDYSILHIIAFYLNRDVYRDDFPLLYTFVDTHPMGSRILDESYDMEGYLPFHRAVQGTNIGAVDWFINHGVDIWKKTRSGWTAFDLSLTRSRCSSLIFVKLLNHITSNLEYKVPSGFDFWCNITSAPLSSLHIAAISDWRCLSEIHENTFIPISRLPFSSCINRHGIDILYLTKLYHDVEWTITLEILGFSLTNTSLSKYPEREAEYHLVYNMFFLTPIEHLDFMFELVNVPDVFRCPGINDLLPHRHVIAERIERCHTDCLRSTKRAILSFLSFFYTVFVDNDMYDRSVDTFTDLVPLMAELRYRCVQMFYKVPSTFWRQVSKAYICSHKCLCLEIMQALQIVLTNKRTQFGTDYVTKFVAERMGWHDTSDNGDVLNRWPFSFLLKKALKMDKDYEYLKILTPFEFDHVDI